MPPTVKFRPDQPLFKADAFHMPLWIHAPFEVLRGITKWLTASLARDNPHRNVMMNATFTRRAKSAHRNAFWSGKPVVKGPKWRTIMRRWAMVFTLAVLVKYLPVAAWLAVGRGVGHVLKFVAMTMVPWAWHNLLWLPIILLAFVLLVLVIKWGVRKAIGSIRASVQTGNTTPWYDYVLRARDYIARWLAR